MKQVHVECNPDELLVSRLGFTRKFIIHHHGKGKVFNRLNKTEFVLALVDEDPGTGKSKYERTLKNEDEKYGIKYFSDSNKNKIFVLKGELEEWILDISKKAKIEPSDFGLPGNNKELKKVILSRLSNLDRLIEELIRQKNPALLQLKSWLQ